MTGQPRGGIRMRSNDFDDHRTLPRWCGKDEGNRPPALEWDGVPEGTAELALICEDPDAPGGNFLHWLVSAIPPSTRGLGGGAELPPDAVEHRNDFGRRGWDGPRPPAGDQPHRYFFRLYAVSRPLRLTAESTSDDLRDALHGAELAHGDLVGLYQR